MKKLFLAALATMMLTGCGKEGYDWGSKEEPMGGNEFGQVTLSVNQGNLVYVKSNTEADNTYTVTTTNTNGLVQALSGAYSTIRGKAITVPVGSYNISAENMTAEQAEQAFEGKGAAHYSGSNTFEVNQGSSTSVSVTCTMVNAKVTFDYDEESFGQMFNLNATGNEAPTIVATPTYSQIGNRSVTITGNVNHESSGAVSFYTVANNAKLNFTITAKRLSDGAVKSYAPATPITLAAKTWHKVKITSSTTNGQASITINVDGTIIEAPEVIVPIDPYTPAQ